MISRGFCSLDRVIHFNLDKIHRKFITFASRIFNWVTAQNRYHVNRFEPTSLRFNLGRGASRGGRCHVQLIRCTSKSANRDCNCTGRREKTKISQAGWGMQWLDSVTDAIFASPGSRENSRACRHDRRYPTSTHVEEDPCWSPRLVDESCE